MDDSVSLLFPLCVCVCAIAPFAVLARSRFRLDKVILVIILITCCILERKKGGGRGGKSTPGGTRAGTPPQQSKPLLDSAHLPLGELHAERRRLLGRGVHRSWASKDSKGNVPWMFPLIAEAVQPLNGIGRLFR